MDITSKAKRINYYPLMWVLLISSALAFGSLLFRVFTINDFYGSTVIIYSYEIFERGYSILNFNEFSLLRTSIIIAITLSIANVCMSLWQVGYSNARWMKLINSLRFSLSGITLIVLVYLTAATSGGRVMFEETLSGALGINAAIYFFAYIFNLYYGVSDRIAIVNYKAINALGMISGCFLWMLSFLNVDGVTIAGVNAVYFPKFLQLNYEPLNEIVSGFKLYGLFSQIFLYLFVYNLLWNLLFVIANKCYRRFNLAKYIYSAAFAVFFAFYSVNYIGSTVEGTIGIISIAILYIFLAIYTLAAYKLLNRKIYSSVKEEMMYDDDDKYYDEESRFIGNLPTAENDGDSSDIVSIEDKKADKSVKELYRTLPEEKKEMKKEDFFPIRKASEENTETVKKEIPKDGTEKFVPQPKPSNYRTRHERSYLIDDDDTVAVEDIPTINYRTGDELYLDSEFLNEEDNEIKLIPIGELHDDNITQEQDIIKEQDDKEEAHSSEEATDDEIKDIFIIDDDESDEDFDEISGFLNAPSEDVKESEEDRLSVTDDTENAISEDALTGEESVDTPSETQPEEELSDELVIKEFSEKPAEDEKAVIEREEVAADTLEIEEQELEIVSEEPELLFIPEEQELEIVPEEPELLFIPEEQELELVPEEPELLFIPEEQELEFVPEEPVLDLVLEEQELEFVPEEPVLELIPEEPELLFIPEEQELELVPEEPELLTEEPVFAEDGQLFIREEELSAPEEVEKEDTDISEECIETEIGEGEKSIASADGEDMTEEEIVIAEEVLTEETIPFAEDEIKVHIEEDTVIPEDQSVQEIIEEEERQEQETKSDSKISYSRMMQLLHDDPDSAEYQQYLEQYKAGLRIQKKNNDEQIKTVERLAENKFMPAERKKVTCDSFYDSLPYKTKKEFVNLFMNPSTLSISRLPKYILGGDNTVFFATVILYLDIIGRKVSSELLLLLYEYVISLYSGDLEFVSNCNRKILDMFNIREDRERSVIDIAEEVCIKEIRLMLKYDLVKTMPVVKRLILIYMRKKKYEEALQLCETAIRLNFTDNTVGGYEGRKKRILRLMEKERDEEN